MAKLVVNPTSPQRRELSLPRSLLSIGRDPSNDLVLADSMVSRRHAVIELRGNQFFLRDCSSSNGSLVNGDRVSERGLRDGDLVAIGTARLLFREDLESLDLAGKVVQHPSAPRLRCAQCGADYRRGDVFCKQCGASVQSAQPKTVCTACGTAVPLPARFCNACGGQLAPGEAQAKEPAGGEQVVAREATAVGAHAESPFGPRPAEAAALASQPDAQPGLAPGAPAPVSATSGLPELEIEIPTGSLEALADVGSELSLRPVAAPDAGAAARTGADKGTPPPRPRSGANAVAAAAPEQTWAPLPRALREAPRAPKAEADRQLGEAADLGSRFLAGVLDFLAVGVAQVLLLLPAASYWWSRELNGPLPFASVALTLALLLFTVALGALYFIYFWGVQGATPGKRLVGLAVCGSEGRFPIGLPRAAARFLGYLLSGALLGGGFLLIALDGSGLHDRLAQTRVVRRRP